MRNAGVGELLLDERQPVLVRDAQDDGMGARLRWPGLACGMDKLRADDAEGQVRTDEAVMGDGVKRGAEVNPGWS